FNASEDTNRRARACRGSTRGGARLLPSAFSAQLLAQQVIRDIGVLADDLVRALARTDTGEVLEVSTEVRLVVVILQARLRPSRPGRSRRAAHVAVLESRGARVALRCHAQPGAGAAHEVARVHDLLLLPRHDRKRATLRPNAPHQPIDGRLASLPVG